MATQTRITRKLRQGNIEIDPNQSCALVVNFTLEVVLVDESGRVLNVMEARQESKVIKLDPSQLLATASKGKGISVAAIATDIINSCKYIHPSRAEEVEQLLIKLRKQLLEAPEPAPAVAEVDLNRTVDLSRTTKGKEKDPTASRSRVEERLPPASMDDIDSYLEMLYQVTGSRGAKNKGGDEDGLQLQIRGTGMILQLCRDVMNLEHLIQNNTLMGALARVLQEEYKKSTELTFNILRIFLAFSNFVEMHCLLSDYRIGLFTLKTIEFELKRAESREAERAEKQAAYEEELRQLSAEEDLSSEERKHKRDKLKRNLDADATKHVKLVQKQDKLLFVAFYILLNLAEDLSVEKKMIKKDVVLYLVGCLGRAHPDLLALVITFLKKISVFEDNKEAIKHIHETAAAAASAEGAVRAPVVKPFASQLVKFVTCSSQPLTIMALRMLFNLSFDKDLRDQMIKAGLLPKVVAQLKVPALRSRLLKLIYHLTLDEKARAMFSYTEGVAMIVGMIVNFPQKLLAKELAALGVNLSLHPKNAEAMVQNKGLNLLMDRLVSAEEDPQRAAPRDPLLLKIIRNISQWTFDLQRSVPTPEQYTHRGLWTPHIKTLVRMALDSYNNHDLLVEVFGILANLTSMDLPANQSWAKLLSMTSDAKPDMSLLELITKVLSNAAGGSVLQDMVLETVLLLGTISLDPQACKVLAKSGAIKALFKLWKDYPAVEVEIHLQILYCFYNLSMQDATQQICFDDKSALSMVVDYLTHKNEAIRSMAYEICDRVAEMDRQEDGTFGDLGKRIRKHKFEYYNQLWLLETHQTKRDSYDDYGPVIKPAINRSPSYFGNLGDLDDEDENDQFSIYSRGGK